MARAQLEGPALLLFGSCEIPLETLLHIGHDIVSACVRCIELKRLLSSRPRLDVSVCRWTEFVYAREDQRMGETRVRVRVCGIEFDGTAEPLDALLNAGNILVKKVVASKKSLVRFGCDSLQLCQPVAFFGLEGALNL